MMRINLLMVCAAFVAEWIADNIVNTVMLVALAHGTLSSDVDQEARKSAIEAIANSSEFLMGRVVFGTATTVGGGYLAARLAKTFPYYNGLGIGLVGVLLTLFEWGDPVWLSVLSLLTTLPASIYGAHIAKMHMTAP